MTAAIPARRVTVCRSCGAGPMVHGCVAPGRVLYGSHGMCKGCAQKHRRAGTLDDHPRVTWRRVVLLEEWRLLRSQGFTRDQAAERLGVKRNALDQALSRARRAGAA